MPAAQTRATTWDPPGSLQGVRQNVTQYMRVVAAHARRRNPRRERIVLPLPEPGLPPSLRHRRPQGSIAVLPAASGSSLLAGCLAPTTGPLL